METLARIIPDVPGTFDPAQAGQVLLPLTIQQPGLPKEQVPSQIEIINNGLTFYRAFMLSAAVDPEDLEPVIKVLDQVLVSLHKVAFEALSQRSAFIASLFPAPQVEEEDE